MVEHDPRTAGSGTQTAVSSRVEQSRLVQAINALNDQILAQSREPRLLDLLHLPLEERNRQAVTLGQEIIQRIFVHLVTKEQYVRLLAQIRSQEGETNAGSD